MFYEAHQPNCLIFFEILLRFFGLAFRFDENRALGTSSRKEQTVAGAEEKQFSEKAIDNTAESEQHSCPFFPIIGTSGYEKKRLI